ncbi:hypothetical protein MPER_02365 [Moniliophthora perniciosa FA553]|nr:hypothetical protein MPER_02365 [Moniliophthora perniciosa FA553]
MSSRAGGLYGGIQFSAGGAAITASISQSQPQDPLPLPPPPPLHPATENTEAQQPESASASTESNPTAGAKSTAGTPSCYTFAFSELY